MSRRATLLPHLQRRDERLLRDFHLAELAHALLAFLLLFEQLAFSGHVAAIALAVTEAWLGPIEVIGKTHTILRPETSKNEP